MKFLLFSIRYYAYSLYKWFTYKEPKRYEYICFILGSYPNNFKNGMLAVLDSKSILTYTIGGTCVVVRFTSTQNIVDVQKTFNSVFLGNIDSYFLFYGDEANTVRGLNEIQHTHLYNKEFNNIPMMQALDVANDFFVIMNKRKQDTIEAIKRQISDSQIGDGNDYFNIDNNNQPQKPLSMDDINPILDKIRIQGIQSLTEEEKQILNKYSKND